MHVAFVNGRRMLKDYTRHFNTHEYINMHTQVRYHMHQYILLLIIYICKLNIFVYVIYLLTSSRDYKWSNKLNASTMFRNVWTYPYMCSTRMYYCLERLLLQIPPIILFAGIIISNLLACSLQCLCIPVAFIII